MSDKLKQRADHDEDHKAVVTLPGTVEKVIPSIDPSQPDKAQIAVEGAEPLYKELRIENTLKNGNGKQVSLKPGAEVEVTIAADPEATTPQDQRSTPHEERPRGSSSRRT